MDEMTQEPCDFVKLVLQRMDSNPEEFEHYGRWNSLCESLERYAGAYTGNRPTPDRQVLWAYDQFEIDLMVAKYRTIYRDREHKNMLKSILVGVEPKAEGTLMRSSSGQQQYATNTAADSQRYATGTLRTGLLTNSVLQQTVTTTLNSAFDDAFRNAVQADGTRS